MAASSLALMTTNPYDEGFLPKLPKKSYQFNRFHYAEGNSLPQAKKNRPCVQLGQARCLPQGRPHVVMPQAHYSSRIADESAVQPTIHSHYKYNVQ